MLTLRFLVISAVTAVSPKRGQHRSDACGCVNYWGTIIDLTPLYANTKLITVGKPALQFHSERCNTKRKRAPGHGRRDRNAPQSGNLPAQNCRSVSSRPRLIIYGQVGAYFRAYRNTHVPGTAERGADLAVAPGPKRWPISRPVEFSGSATSVSSDLPT